MKLSRDLQTYALRVADELKGHDLKVTAAIVRAVIMGALWALTKLNFLVKGKDDRDETDPNMN